MYRKCFTLGVSFLLVTSAYAQLQFLPDSVDRQFDSLRIYPDRNSVAINSFGNYVHNGANGINMQTYAGFNIANTLRGHVPNLNLNDNIEGVGGDGLRYNSNMLIIDGMPYAPEMSSFHNLNSFEYQSIGTISSGNQLAIYGGVAANGAIILESKNGKNINKPFFEGNSSSSFLHTPAVKTSIYEREAQDQWAFTNAAAYAQDYGKVDLRVSYANSMLISDGSNGGPDTGINAIRLNAGFEMSPRFSMRLIADSRYVNSDGSFGESPYDYSENRPSLNGNLLMKFVVNDWLAITSQSSLARTEQDRETEQTTFSTEFLNRQARDLVNVFATITPVTSERLRLTFMTGGQTEKQKIDYRSSYKNELISGSESMEVEGKTRSWLAQGQLVFNDVFFADVNYRYEYYKNAADDQKYQPHYSFNTAFDFARAFSLERSSFSGGRIRFSAGKFNMVDATGFPFEVLGISSYDPWAPGIIPNPYLEPTSRKSIETGADLSFANSRLTFNGTYYNNLNSQTFAYMYSPTPGNGSQVVIVDMGPTRMEGWEFALGGYPARSENMVVYTKLIYGRYESFLQPEEDSDFQGLDLSSHLPDWTGSVLGQIELKRFFASMLVTHRKGGEVRIFDGAIYPSPTSNQTQMWLQDISVGYKFSKVNVSLSGRNLLSMIDKRDEIDHYLNPRSKKIITASVTVKI